MRDLGDTVVHELGHQISHTLSKKDWKEWNALYNDSTNLDWPSSYAFENSLEAFAETTTALITGAKVPNAQIAHWVQARLQKLRRVKK